MKTLLVFLFTIIGSAAFSQTRYEIGPNVPFEDISIKISNDLPFADIKVSISEEIAFEDFSVGLTQNKETADFIITKAPFADVKVKAGTDISFPDLTIEYDEDVSFKDISILITDEYNADYKIYADDTFISKSDLIIALLPIINKKMNGKFNGIIQQMNIKQQTNNTLF